MCKRLSMAQSVITLFIAGSLRTTHRDTPFQQRPVAKRHHGFLISIPKSGSSCEPKSRRFAQSNGPRGKGGVNVPRHHIDGLRRTIPNKTKSNFRFSSYGDTSRIEADDPFQPPRTSHKRPRNSRVAEQNSKTSSGNKTGNSRDLVH